MKLFLPEKILMGERDDLRNHADAFRQATWNYGGEKGTAASWNDGGNQK